MSTDAIVVLKDDHKKSASGCSRSSRAGDDAGASEGPDRQGDHEELTVHTYLENEVMYPEVRTLLPDLEADILESYEEHHVADVLCIELATMTRTTSTSTRRSPSSSRASTHHIGEEEQDWFPKVREGLGRNQLQEIGARMQELRPNAPTTPSAPKALKKALDAIRA